jgi:hypothetical protein
LPTFPLPPGAAKHLLLPGAAAALIRGSPGATELGRARSGVSAAAPESELSFVHAGAEQPHTGGLLSWLLLLPLLGLAAAFAAFDVFAWRARQALGTQTTTWPRRRALPAVTVAPQSLQTARAAPLAPVQAAYPGVAPSAARSAAAEPGPAYPPRAPEASLAAAAPGESPAMAAPPHAARGGMTEGVAKAAPAGAFAGVMGALGSAATAKRNNMLTGGHHARAHAAREEGELLYEPASGEAGGALAHEREGDVSAVRHGKHSRRAQPGYEYSPAHDAAAHGGHEYKDAAGAHEFDATNMGGHGRGATNMGAGGGHRGLGQSLMAGLGLGSGTGGGKHELRRQAVQDSDGFAGSGVGGGGMPLGTSGGAHMTAGGEVLELSARYFPAGPSHAGEMAVFGQSSKVRSGGSGLGGLMGRIVSGEGGVPGGEGGVPGGEGGVHGGEGGVPVGEGGVYGGEAGQLDTTERGQLGSGMGAM